MEKSSMSSKEQNRVRNQTKHIYLFKCFIEDKLTMFCRVVKNKKTLQNSKDVYNVFSLL